MLNFWMLLWIGCVISNFGFLFYFKFIKKYKVSFIFWLYLVVPVIFVDMLRENIKENNKI